VEYMRRQYGMCHWNVCVDVVCVTVECISKSIIKTQCQCSTSVPTTHL